MGRLKVDFENQYVAIDTMVLIYLIENHSMYGGLCEKILSSARRICFSDLGLAEVLVGFEKKEEFDRKMPFVDFLSHHPTLQLRSFGPNEAFNFAHLRCQYPHLKTPDLMHIATAISAGADLFLTQDRALKKITHIPVLLLEEVKLSFLV